MEEPALSDIRQPTTDDFEVFAPEHTVSADTLEIAEIYKTVSPEAATIRARQLERNRHRRELNSNRKRFEQMALRVNLKNAAERLAAKKQAESVKQDELAKKPLVSVTAQSPQRQPKSAKDRY